MQGGTGVAVDRISTILAAADVIEQQFVSAIRNVVQEKRAVMTVVGKPEIAIEHLGVGIAQARVTAPLLVGVVKNRHCRRRAIRVIQNSIVDVIPGKIVPIGERNHARRFGRQQRGWRRRETVVATTREIDGDGRLRAQRRRDQQTIQERKCPQLGEHVFPRNDLIFHILEWGYEMGTTDCGKRKKLYKKVWLFHVVGLSFVILNRNDRRLSIHLWRKRQLFFSNPSRPIPTPTKSALAYLAGGGWLRKRVASISRAS